MKSLFVASRRMALVMTTALLASVTVATAQPATDPERIAAAKEMFTAMGQDAQFEAVIVTMFNGLGQSFKQQRPNATREIDEAIAKMIDKFRSRKSEAVDMSAALYAEKMTAAELREIAQFYRSTVGRKLVAEQPGITQKSMAAGMEWGRRLGREVEQELRQELKRRGIDL